MSTLSQSASDSKSNIDQNHIEYDTFIPRKKSVKLPSGFQLDKHDLLKILHNHHRLLVEKGWPKYEIISAEIAPAKSTFIISYRSQRIKLTFSNYPNGVSVLEEDQEESIMGMTRIDCTVEECDKERPEATAMGYTLEDAYIMQCSTVYWVLVKLCGLGHHIRTKDLKVLFREITDGKIRFL